MIPTLKKHLRRSGDVTHTITKQPPTKEDLLTDQALRFSGTGSISIQIRDVPEQCNSFIVNKFHKVSS